MQVMTEGRISRHSWWMLLVRGILALLFGVIALAFPRLTVVVLVALFGAYALVDGIFAVVVSFQERQVTKRWWVLLIEGIVGILVGLLVFILPTLATALALLYVIAAWAIITGIFEIGAGFMLGASIGRGWLIAIAGIVSVLFGIVLIVAPGAGILSLIWLVAVYAIVFGVLLIVRAFQFRSTGSSAPAL
jgi:uncharacterized membrane protein HdeD (DUF308 family)